MLSDNHTSENIVQRLGRRIAQARQQGFDVRIEHLDEGQSGWCQMGARKIIFIDLAAVASEQLAQLDDALVQYCEQLTQTESPSQPNRPANLPTANSSPEEPRQPPRRETHQEPHRARAA